MAAAYGTIIFAKSNDCSFNSDKLDKVLRTYIWSECEGMWEYDSMNQRFNFSTEYAQFPTLFPRPIISFDLWDESTDKSWTVLAEDMKKEDYEFIDDRDEGDSEKLDTLSKKIAPCLSSGWIEFSLCSNMNTRYVMFETLRIYFDGKAERHGYISHTDSGLEQKHETV